LSFTCSGTRDSTTARTSIGTSIQFTQSTAR
jgi:hypothetical protein